MVRKTHRNRNLRRGRSKWTGIAVVVGVLTATIAWAWSRRSGGNTVYDAETRQAIESEIERLTELYYLPDGLMKAICMVESGCVPVTSIGEAGEIGLMQVTPSAMLDMDYQIGLGSPIHHQLEAGAKWLRHLADRWTTEIGGIFDFITDWDFVIRAYNAGFDGASRGNGQAYLTRVLNNWTDRPYLS